MKKRGYCIKYCKIMLFEKLILKEKQAMEENFKDI